MKCIILAAGYATRLYPITENFPKPLLDVGGKPILDWLIDDISASDSVDEYIVVSNHKFAPQFNKWASENRHNITVIDDGTTTNENRLGAVRDIVLACDSLSSPEDCMVIAGDNVLDFSLTQFIDYFNKKDASVVMRYYEPDSAKLKKSGVIELDDCDRVIDMAEKPSDPKSHWCCPPFYIYKASDIARISDAIKNGCNVDAPGSFVEWLCKHANVYALEMPGRRYDVGTVESYTKIKNEYKGILK
ncbi:MAG: nucleotidyltransferase family protein [Clostridia bacterium]|nr:nucleotidyltransferase family protein [Clostridia bacterium]